MYLGHIIIMPSVLIAGGTGFVGDHLRRHLLAQYWEIYILTRNKSLAKMPQYIYWNPSDKSIDITSPRTFDIIINLAGENIGYKIWTRSRKELLLNSRIESTSYLAALIDEKKISASYCIQASAIGIYGDRGYEILTESSVKGEGFLSNMTYQWEDAAKQISIPLSILRIGVVFHPQKGAFPKLILGLKFKLCLLFAGGSPYISWIEIDDLCRMILFLIDNQKQGVYNAVSPQPIQHLYLLKKFNKKYNRISMTLSISKKITQWLFGDFSELLVFSQKVSSQKIQSEGFEFTIPRFRDFLGKYWKKI